MGHDSPQVGAQQSPPFPEELGGLKRSSFLVEIDNFWSWSILSWLDLGWSNNFNTSEMAISGRITICPDDGGFGARSWIWSPGGPGSTPFEPVPNDASWSGASSNLVPPRSASHRHDWPQQRTALSAQPAIWQIPDCRTQSNSFRSTGDAGMATRSKPSASTLSELAWR